MPRIMGMITLFKDLQQFIRGSNNAFVLNQATKTGATPLVNDEFLVKQDANWPYICSRIVASTVAQTPLRLFATRSTGQMRAKSRTGASGRIIPRSSKTYQYLASHPSVSKVAHFVNADEVEEIFDHPFLDLMRTTNDDGNGFEAMYLTSVFMDLTGDAYWNLEDGPLGIPEKLFVLLSQFTRVVPGTEELVRGYLYGRDITNRQALAADEVVHFMWPNPEDIYYGKGCLEPILASNLRDRKMDALEAGLLDNSGRPETLLGYKQKLTPSDRKALQAEWDKMARRSKGAGGIRITSHEPVIYKLGESLKDMAFPKGRMFNRDQCYNSFGVPLSLAESKDFGNASFEGSLRGFGRFTIFPKLIIIQDKINEKIIPRYAGGDRLIAVFDNPVPEDVALNLQIEKQRLETGVILVNEVRAEIGKDPYEGGDIPLTLVKVGAAAPTQTSHLDDDESKAVRRKAEFTPSDEPTQEFPGGIDGGSVDPLTSNERKLSNNVKSFLDEFQTQVGDVIKDITTLPDLADLAESGILETSIAEKMTMQFSETSAEQLGKAMLKGGQTGQKRLGIDVSMWIEQDDAIEAMRQRSIKFSNGVFNTQSKAVNKILTKSLDEGETIAEATKALQKHFGKNITRAKAEEIARTEISRSEHIGMRKLWQETGVVKGVKWDAIGDSCAFCLDMDGKLVGLTEPFFDANSPIQEVEFRGRTITQDHSFDTVHGPPLHPNCRCSLNPVLLD